MSKTKIGPDQINQPAPLWFRRLTNAIILCFLPGYIGLVQGLTMSDEKRNILMLVGATIPFLLKGFGMILGNGQVYEPTNQEVDAENEKATINKEQLN